MIKMSRPGEPLDPNAELALGVLGYAIEEDGIIWIPAISAANEGDGRVGRFLDALPRDRTIRFPTVISARLAGMLTRRGFVAGSEFVEEIGESVDYFERRPHDEACETCGGDETLTELVYRNGRDVEIEHPCPACQTDDYDDREPDERNPREVRDDAYDDRASTEYRERLSIAFGRSFVEEL